MRDESIASVGFDIHLIDEPGYRRNVSLARLYSHSIFVKNFAEWFTRARRGAEFDLVYSAYPLVSTNIFLGDLKVDYGFKLIVDVQDVWPEAISAAIPVLARLPARWIPFSKRANRAYRAADGLVAVSHTYLKRAMNANRGVPGKVTYIGSDATVIEGIAAEPWTKAGIHFVYIGTLSHSYDMETVVCGFAKLKQSGRSYFLHILGDGPHANDLKKIAPDNVTFYGFLPYVRMVALAKSADVFVNAIKAESRTTITNKVSDYIVMGKTIVNSQTTPEVREFLSQVGAIDYCSGDVDSFVAAAELAVKAAGNKLIYAESADALRSAFSRERSYPELISFIEALGASHAA